LSFYTYLVPARPFSIGPGNNKLRVSNKDETIFNTQTFATAAYVNQGNTVVASPTDFVSALQTAVNAAVAALGLSGVWTIALQTDGRLLWTIAGGSDNIVIHWDYPDSIRPDYAGEDGETDQTLYENGQFSSSIVYGRWHAGIDEDYDSGDVHLIVAREVRSLTGRPSRVRYGTGAPPADRRVVWSRIFGARVKQSRADDAAYAIVAGIPTGDDATLESWKLDLIDDPGPYDDSRVYLYTTNDPTTAVREGPYQVIWEESRPPLEGVDAEGYRRGDSAETFAVSLHFWKDPNP
jgi:hypothetical protein